MMPKAFNAGAIWLKKDEDRLIWLFERSRSLLDMAQELGRSGGAICARLQHLNLIYRDDRSPCFIRFKGGEFVNDAMVRNVNQIMMGKDDYVCTANEMKHTNEVDSISTQQPAAKPQGDPIMSLINAQAAVSTVTVQQRGETVTATYIYGKPADQVTDDTVYEYIAELESKMESLGRIKNQPMTLKAKLKSVQAEIDALVKVVDDRNPQAAS